MDIDSFFGRVFLKVGIFKLLSDNFLKFMLLFELFVRIDMLFKLLEIFKVLSDKFFIFVFILFFNFDILKVNFFIEFVVFDISFLFCWVFELYLDFWFIESSV